MMHKEHQVSGSPFPDPKDWHDLRLKNVGGSEVAALFDAQPSYAMSRYALWHVKGGYAPPPEVANERAEWGLRLEASIAEAAAQQEGWKIRKGGYVVDETTPGMGCTLDYIIDEHSEGESHQGFGVLEVKNADWLQHKRTWVDGEPPLHILLQLQHQLACTGYNWGAVGCLIGGNILEVYRYHARPKLIAEIRKRVTEFWQSIAENKVPAVDGSESASKVLRELYPETYDTAIDLSASNEFPIVCAALLRATELRKKYENEEEQAKNAIKALLGENRRGFGGGYLVSVAVTPAQLARVAKPGETINGRAESRRITVKELTS